MSPSDSGTGRGGGSSLVTTFSAPHLTVPPLLSMLAVTPVSGGLQRKQEVYDRPRPENLPPVSKGRKRTLPFFWLCIPSGPPGMGQCPPRTGRCPPRMGRWPPRIGPCGGPHGWDSALHGGEGECLYPCTSQMLTACTTTLTDTPGDDACQLSGGRLPITTCVCACSFFLGGGNFRGAPQGVISLAPHSFLRKRTAESPSDRDPKNSGGWVARVSQSYLHSKHAGAPGWLSR